MKRYQLAISGAADGPMVNVSKEAAREVGQAIARMGHVTMTGATHGLPYWAAKGAKQAGGISVGVSPAPSLRSHVGKFRLPDDVFDAMIFTGFEYVGRDLVLVRSADAVIIVAGRTGTLHEFAIAFEEKTPIGVLVGSGGVADEVKGIIDMAHKGKGQVVYEENPVILVKKVIDLLKKGDKK